LTSGALTSSASSIFDNKVEIGTSVSSFGASFFASYFGSSFASLGALGLLIGSAASY
jgi:hypothetical protein